jgi:hypothetical protein
MTAEQREMIMDLRDPPTAEDNDWEMVDEIIAGNITMPISHAGGELQALADLREGVRKTYVFYFC